MPPRRTQKVDATTLRRKFNDGGYWARAEAGEYKTKILREGHPSPERSGQPFCTRSQYIAYRDFWGQKVAEVHQYRRPDGRIGGSGKPDPKVLVEGDTLYYV